VCRESKAEGAVGTSLSERSPSMSLRLRLRLSCGDRPWTYTSTLYTEAVRLKLASKIQKRQPLRFDDVKMLRRVFPGDLSVPAPPKLPRDEPVVACTHRGYYFRSTVRQATAVARNTMHWRTAGPQRRRSPRARRGAACPSASHSRARQRAGPCARITWLGDGLIQWSCGSHRDGHA
jgi:hypothetical protein